MSEPLTCTCDDAAIVRLSLEGQDVPPCGVHRPTRDGGSTVALNSPELTDIVTAALGDNATPTPNL